MTQFLFTVWFPHSGGRLFNRQLLPLFSDIKNLEIFNPLLLLSTDQILRLDTTEQVHKHRSISNLRGVFDLVYDSVAVGREKGLEFYFNGIQELGLGHKYVGGALPCGASVAKFDYQLINKLCPDAKFIHLVRHPLDCLNSFVKRREFDGDYQRVLHSWVEFNRRALDEIQGSSLVVRFEDLLIDPSNVMKRVADWLHLDVPTESMDFDVAYYGIAEHKKDLGATNHVDVHIETICGPLLESLGYDTK